MVGALRLLGDGGGGVVRGHRSGVAGALDGADQCLDVDGTTRFVVDVEALVRTVERTGYTAAVASDDATSAASDDEQRADHDYRRRLVVAAPLSALVLVLTMLPGIPDTSLVRWTALLLATPVVLWAGWPFHRAAR